MDENNTELAVLMGRMESKIDAIALSLNAKIDALTDKLDFKMENVTAKIVAGDNEANARLGLLQERQHGLAEKVTEVENSLKRAYGFLAAISIAVISGIIMLAVQALAK